MVLQGIHPVLGPNTLVGGLGSGVEYLAVSLVFGPQSYGDFLLSLFLLFVIFNSPRIRAK